MKKRLFALRVAIKCYLNVVRQYELCPNEKLTGIKFQWESKK